MGCATTSVKITSIVFYIILAALAIGGVTYIALNPELLHEDMAISAYVGCGLVVAFSLLGCIAAIQESVFLTAACAVFLMLLAILQIGYTSIDWQRNGDVRSGIAIVHVAWENQNMDTLQTEHKCCGKVSANDYVRLNKQIPGSCYSASASIGVHSEADLFLQGCSSKLQQHFDGERLWFLIFSILLAAFEIFGFFMALFLVINFRNKKRRLLF